MNAIDMTQRKPPNHSAVRSLEGEVSAEEWQARVDLAATYRLIAHYGWDDMIFTHISARIPGPEHHFLINPYGMFFGEMTASALVKVDLDGNIVDKTPYYINPAGFTIHSAVHAARDDAHYVMHLHSDQGVAVSAHMSGDFEGWREALARQFIDNARRWLNGEPPLNIVDKRHGFVVAEEGERS